MTNFSFMRTGQQKFHMHSNMLLYGKPNDAHFMANGIWCTVYGKPNDAHFMANGIWCTVYGKPNDAHSMASEMIHTLWQAELCTQYSKWNDGHSPLASPCVLEISGFREPGEPRLVSIPGGGLGLVLTWLALLDMLSCNTEKTPDITGRSFPTVTPVTVFFIPRSQILVQFAQDVKNSSQASTLYFHQLPICARTNLLI